MKRLYIFIILLPLLLLGFLFVSVFRPKADFSRVCFENICFDVEVADTVEKRQRGLMYQESMTQNEGMFFVFDRVGEHSFWMKNTLIPLDIIWLDSDYKVVDIQTAVPCEAHPCTSYVPKASARYVLEINANLASEFRISQGTQARVQ